MRKLSLLALTTALVATTSMAANTEITIGAGSAEGEYTNTIVPAIDQALKEYDFSAKAQEGAGSQQNIEDLMSGKLTAVLSQLDVAALNLGSDDSERYLILGRIAPEALLCAVRKEGRVRNFHDLTDDHEKPLKISVGPEKSGSARTLEFLISLDEELGDIKLVHKKNTAVELSRLASGNRDAVCFVMMPNPDNDLIEIVAGNDDLAFMEFVNPSFADTRVNDQAIYDYMEVPVTPGIWGLGADKVNTLITWVGVVVDEEAMDEDALNALATVVLKPDLLPPTSAAGRANELWGKVSDKAKEYAAAAKVKYNELAEATKRKAQELREGSQ